MLQKSDPSKCGVVNIFVWEVGLPGKKLTMERDNLKPKFKWMQQHLKLTDDGISHLLRTCLTIANLAVRDNLKPTNSAKFGPTILNVAGLENINLTDLIWLSKYRIMICEMPELKGVNPATDIATRESAFCDASED